MFSWFVWFLMTAIGFFGQIVGGAGAGAWVTGFTSIACLGIFLLSIKKGTREIVLADWIALTGALLALLLWYLTKTPVWSAILISISDVLALIPTIRKSYSKPYQETLISYALSGLKFVFAILALNTYSITTTVYPATLIFSNWGFVMLLLIRRRVIPER